MSEQLVSPFAAEMKIYLDLAASVPGWRRSDEAAALFTSAYSLPADAVIVEIGAFFGRSSILLAGARKLRGSGKITVWIRSIVRETTTRFRITGRF